MAVRFGSRVPLAVGGVIGAAGLMLLGIGHATHAEVVFFTMVFYAGMGLAHAAIPNLIIDAVPLDQTGEATGFNTTVRVVGAALGTQICGTILATSAVAGSLVPSQDGFRTAFLVVAAILICASLLTLRIPKVSADAHRVGAPAAG
jgi:MFS family permease